MTEGEEPTNPEPTKQPQQANVQDQSKCSCSQFTLIKKEKEKEKKTKYLFNPPVTGRMVQGHQTSVRVNYHDAKF